jgi:hypothetical protein
MEIPALKLIKDIFSIKSAQRSLIKLYADSQSECTRNSKCGMEIGMSREKDQGAFLKYFLGDLINLDINNELPEDYIVLNEKISAKHSQGKVGTPVKAKWTSADSSVKDAIKYMLDADINYYPHLLITYIDLKGETITICCITSEHNRNTIKGLGEGAFKIPKGNSRGIEYSSTAMKELMKNVYFKIDIPNANLKGGEDPIRKRINLIKQLQESAGPSLQ